MDSQIDQCLTELRDLPHKVRINQAIALLSGMLPGDPNSPETEPRSGVENMIAQFLPSEVLPRDDQNSPKVEPGSLVEKLLLEVASFGQKFDIIYFDPASINLLEHLSVSIHNCIFPLREEEARARRAKTLGDWHRRAKSIEALGQPAYKRASTVLPKDAKSPIGGLVQEINRQITIMNVHILSHGECHPDHIGYIEKRLRQIVESVRPKLSGQESLGEEGSVTGCEGRLSRTGTVVG
jgi:hypothetical protein